MSDEKPGLSRRSALRLIATTATAVPAMGAVNRALSGTGVSNEAVVVDSKKSPKLKKPKKAIHTRTPSDPDLLNPTITWDFVLEKTELVTLAALCDVIIPADEFSPSASSLGTQDYINEHTSAPYANNKADLVVIRGGIVWLNSESQKRFGKVFAALSNSQKRKLCEEIKWEKSAKPEFQAAARFFAKVRNLTATAFYTTEKGMVDIGYVGNKPNASFPGPPLEVLLKLGLKP